MWGIPEEGWETAMAACVLSAHGILGLAEETDWDFIILDNGILRMLGNKRP